MAAVAFAPIRCPLYVTRLVHRLFRHLVYIIISHPEKSDFSQTIEEYDSSLDLLEMSID